MNGQADLLLEPVPGKSHEPLPPWRNHSISR